MSDECLLHNVTVYSQCHCSQTKSRLMKINRSFLIRHKIKENLSPISGGDASEQQKVNGDQDGGEDGGQAGDENESQAGQSHEGHFDGAVLVTTLDVCFFIVHSCFIIIIHYTWLFEIVIPSAERTK